MHSKQLEIWAGLECTINRVQSSYNNQILLNGHVNRMADLDLFALLGIKKLRYPILWESVAPNSLKEVKWDWVDSRMNRIHELDITPIAGLLHHGSGPRYTSLLDNEFPQKLAQYAALVAERYPWIEWYTPVNEPLTTARFSCLYGFWYPHHKNDQSMIRALLNQLKGTVLAMREIHKINPNAKLIQTEDIGRVLATAPIQYQANFENIRRWLTFDLLLGKVDRTHPAFKYLTDNGATRAKLKWFQINSFPIDILGINHYPLSNRFLDHRLALYPNRYHGGNGKDEYVDVGAVDSGQVLPPPPIDIYREVWERYHQPIAVTEAHIGGPREAQMRWLQEIYLSAQQLRSEGAHIKAITCWSLLGSFEWASLCTTINHHYESGVFDVRALDKPRATAIASMIKKFSVGEEVDHPVLSNPGYWHQAERVLFAASDRLPSSTAWFSPSMSHHPILITGARGTLGGAFARICEKRGLDFIVLTRQQMDIGNFASVRKALRAYKPWAVVNAAGYVKVDDAEDDPILCHRENTLGPKNLALACNELKISFLTFSSDLVFDGNRTEPYSERHLTAPLNIYGISKAQAEKEVLEINVNSLIIRTSSFFGPWDSYNFAHYTREALSSGQTVRAADDVTISPTYVPDLVHNSLDLLIDSMSGIIHLTNQGQISWANWARKAAFTVGKSHQLIHGCSILDFKLPAARPFYTAMTSERMNIMPPFEDAWQRYLRCVS